MHGEWQQTVRHITRVLMLATGSSLTAVGHAAKVASGVDKASSGIDKGDTA